MRCPNRFPDLISGCHPYAIIHIQGYRSNQGTRAIWWYYICMDENEDHKSKPFTREDFLRDLKRVVGSKPPSDEIAKRRAQSVNKKS